MPVPVANVAELTAAIQNAKAGDEIILAAERARQLAHGATPLIECENKPAVTALREIADGQELGDYGPYRQSERLGLYREWADRLVAGGRAYPCFCTDAELEANIGFDDVGICGRKYYVGSQRLLRKRLIEFRSTREAKVIGD